MLRGLYKYAHPVLDLSGESLAFLSKIDHLSIGKNAQHKTLLAQIGTAFEQEWQ
jgi:hypothetical protein